MYRFAKDQPVYEALSYFLSLDFLRRNFESGMPETFGEKTQADHKRIKEKFRQAGIKVKTSFKPEPYQQATAWDDEGNPTAYTDTLYDKGTILFHSVDAKKLQKVVSEIEAGYEARLANSGQEGPDISLP